MEIQLPFLACETFSYQLRARGKRKAAKVASSPTTFPLAKKLPLLSEDFSIFHFSICGKARQDKLLPFALKNGRLFVPFRGRERGEGGLALLKDISPENDALSLEQEIAVGGK